MVLSLPILADEKAASEDAAKPMEAVAVLQPTEGSSVEGTVTFRKTMDDQIQVEARVTGLLPNQKHAIHIHEFGDLTAPDGKSAGGHFNPGEHPHGLPSQDSVRHAGDLGNLEADENGTAEYTVKVANFTIDGESPILGRAVIVHAGADTGEQPTGGAGDRLAQGVIGIKQPSSTTASLIDQTKGAINVAVEAISDKVTQANE